MTKIIAVVMLLLIALYLALPCKLVASAEEYSWARIVKDDVNLYADENCDKLLFTLEKSYYVEILQTLSNVYQVSVMQNKEGFPTIVGYVRKIEATPVEAAPLQPLYPTEQIYVTSDSAQLKLLPLASSENVVVATTTQKLNYYGTTSYYGKQWYYVYYAGKFGYVEVSNVSKPTIALHPTPLETAKPVIKPQQPDDSNTDEPNDKQSSKMPAAEIILIVFVVLLAGGLTFAMFLPDKGKRADVFEQDI